MELGGAAGLGVDGTRALTAEGSWKSGWGLVSPMGAVSSAGTNAGRVCRRSNECPMNGSFIGARRRGGCGRRWNARADGRRQLFFGLGPWLVHTCCLCPLALRKRGRFRRRSNECPMNVGSSLELGGAAGVGVDGTRALTIEDSWKSGWGLGPPMGAVSLAHVAPARPVPPPFQ